MPAQAGAPRVDRVQREPSRSRRPKSPPTPTAPPTPSTSSTQRECSGVRLKMKKQGNIQDMSGLILQNRMTLVESCFPDYMNKPFFSNQGENGSHDPNVKYNMGTSTAFVYEKDGGISKFEACTYPSDSKNFATVPEGIYEAQKGLHKNAYPALRLSDVGTENFSDNTIELGAPNPSNPSVTVAKYINIHKAGINNCTGDAKTIISAGCLLIDVNNWDQFIDKFDYDATISVTVSRSISIPTDKNIIKRQDVPSIKVTLPTDVLRVVQPLFINNK